MAEAKAKTPGGEGVGEEKPVEALKPVAEEVPKLVAPAAPIQVVSPLEREEFDPLLELYMKKLGIGDRKAAMAMLTVALKNMKVDPYENINKAIQTANNLTTVLKAFPDTPVTKRVKDMAQGMAVSKVTEQMSSPGAVDPDERMARIMERFMPYKIVMDMFGGRPMGGEGQGESAAMGEVKKLREDFQSFMKSTTDSEKDKKLEDRFTKLEGMITQGKQGEASEVVKKLEEIKAGLSPKETETVKKLDTLIEKISEKQEKDKFDEMREELLGMKQGLEGQIAAIRMAGEGEGKDDELTKLSNLLGSVGKIYDSVASAAGQFGFETKDEKLTGDMKRDILALGKDVIKVVGKAVERRGKAPPPVREVRQLPADQVVRIPIGKGKPGPRIEGKPAAAAQPAKAQPAPTPTLPREAPIDFHGIEAVPAAGVLERHNILAGKSAPAKPGVKPPSAAASVAKGETPK